MIEISAKGRETELEDYMKKLKVALIQYDTVMPDIKQNTITAMKLIREAGKNGADMVLLLSHGVCGAGYL